MTVISRIYKVAIIGPLPPPVHGVTVAIERVLNARNKGPFEFVHLDTSDPRDATTVGRNDLENYFLAVRSYVQLLEICLRQRLDIVYVPISQSFIGYARDSIYFVIARMFSRARVVIHLHGGHFEAFYLECGWLVRKYIDTTMKLAERAIVLSEVFRGIFTRWFPPSCIDVVPNGTIAEVESIAHKKKKFQFRNAGVRTVTFMSNLIGTKGIYEFLSAAICCLEKHPDLKFLVAGEWWGEDPELKKKTMLLLDEIKENRIQFLGLVSGRAKSELLKDTDILVLPTYYPFEGQPTVIIEAMSAGIPVVSTHHACIPDMVVDKRTGLLVPVKDVNALARAICRIVEDPSLWIAMSEASLERFQLYYTEETSTRALISSFARAVETSKS